jgi:adenosylcobinamide kinase/adenosylcobinamide-phosphate guanylyltransferase
MTILLTGGSANGKSAIAERFLSRFPEPRYYLATMQPFGDGALAKIERHRAMRVGKRFRSLERFSEVADVTLEPGASVLLECLCNLTANVMFDLEGNLDAAAYERVLSDVVELVGKCANLIVVTNDVGAGTPHGYADSTNAYVETLGRLNAALAQRFDAVFEVVAGIPLRLKGDEACVQF